MKTRKPISTISYNSEAFLQRKLQELSANGIIEFWYYIKHLGEYDETTGLTDKDHIHLKIVPSMTIQTTELAKEFIEITPDNPKPLKCMPFENSKLQDGVLYDLHDEEYLKIKLQEKRYHYSLDDFVTSDEDYLKHIYSEAVHSDIFKHRKVIEKFANGFSLADMCYSGYVEPHNAFYLKTFEQLFWQGAKEK